MNPLTQEQLLDQFSMSAEIYRDSGLADFERYIGVLRSFTHGLLIVGGLSYDDAQELVDEAAAKGKSSSQDATK